MILIAMTIRHDVLVISYRRPLKGHNMLMSNNFQLLE